MSDDGLPSADEKFLDDLAQDALSEDENDFGPTPRYTHAFVCASLCEVLTAIRTGCRRRSIVACRIFGATPMPDRSRLYLAGVDGGTLMWMAQTALAVAGIVSRQLQSVVHWISVYESYACRAYVEFTEGKCNREVLDPTDFWVSNVLDADSLVGKGTRRFASHEDFRSAIDAMYIPRDDSYDFEMIDQMVLQGDRRLEGIMPMLQLDCRQGRVSLAFLGKWPHCERERIEAALRDS